MSGREIKRALLDAVIEDTVLATANGLENLSPDPEWPTVAAGGRQRPDVLA